MKKYILVLLIVAVLIFLPAGCKAEVKTFTDAGQEIAIGVNEEFTIALGSNPTTGYIWQASYDETMLELVTSSFEQEATDDVVGAGGVEYFRFQALGPGETDLTMTYSRPWEEKSLNEVSKDFTITIVDS